MIIAYYSFAQTGHIDNNDSIPLTINKTYDDREILYLNGEIPIGREVKPITEQIASQNLVSDSVRVVIFSGLYHCPEEIGQFSNIEKIVFEYWTFDLPQDKFKKLVSVEVEHYEIIDFELFDDYNWWWLDKVEKLNFGKIIGLKIENLLKLRNLKYIRFYGVEMKNFPLEINELKHLKIIRLINFVTYEKIDLSKIDLSNFPDFEEFKIIAGSNFYGIPKGLEGSNKNYIIQIEHPNLTKKEKRILSKFEMNEEFW